MTINEQIVALYQEGHSGPTIGRLLGCHSSRVYDLLRRQGIPARLHSDFDHLRGDKHPMWGRKHTDDAKRRVGEANKKPGSKHLSIDGYVLVVARDHPYADSNGHVREHRLVMERRLGRFLLPSEVVHHINEIKTDNSDDNLELFPSVSAHSRHHARTTV